LSRAKPECYQIRNRVTSVEASSNSFNIPRRVLGKTKNGALSSIIVPGGRIYDQGQITDVLIERNQKHFGQAHGTPFTVPPLSNWDGWHGTSEWGDAVLQGKLPPDDIMQCTEAARAIPEALQQEIAPPDSVVVRRLRPHLRPVNISDIRNQSQHSNAPQRMTALLALAIASSEYSLI
jgi:hypothetical protein